LRLPQWAIFQHKFHPDPNGGIGWLSKMGVAENDDWTLFLFNYLAILLVTFLGW